MRKLKFITFSILVLALLVSCGVQSGPVLSLTGEIEASYTQKELESMSSVESIYTNKDGETTVYSGISINEIFIKQGIVAFSAVNIVASDGYSANVTYDELSACSDCVLSYSKDNNWSAVMPNFSGKFQVKDVVEFTVK
jgi:hypothetical protein